MKRIGILGGMSPESTAEYYLHIIRCYVKRFGDYSYPEIVIHSVSFHCFQRSAPRTEAICARFRRTYLG